MLGLYSTASVHPDIVQAVVQSMAASVLEPSKARFALRSSILHVLEGDFAIFPGMRDDGVHWFFRTAKNPSRTTVQALMRHISTMVTVAERCVDFLGYS
jgi:hypothetical protein